MKGKMHKVMKACDRRLQLNEDVVILVFKKNKTEFDIFVKKSGKLEIERLPTH